MSKYLIQCKELMKQEIQNGMKLQTYRRIDGSIDVEVEQMQNRCKNKQCWNEDKFRCECKELIDKGRCDKAFI